LKTPTIRIIVAAKAAQPCPVEPFREASISAQFDGSDRVPAP
jgi:hypothetical protein